jgi:ketosteroid isomerase-like protein
MLDLATILEIHQLVALYGHIIDEKDLSRLDEIYMRDAVFDMTAMGFPMVKGIESIRDFLDTMHVQQRLDNAPNPLAHHASNVIVTEESDGVCHVMSKAIGFSDATPPKIHSGLYRDIVKKTPDGWRFARRTALKLGTLENTR